MCGIRACAPVACLCLLLCELMQETAAFSLRMAAASPKFSSSQIVEMTKRYTDLQLSGDPAQKAKAEEMIADDYVFRGPIIGPFTRKDLQAQQGKFNLQDAFPDYKVSVWGFTTDPENPQRCYYFMRYCATHTSK
uniref:SnoaL-like domain-containing protein n=1 Tax=Chromera velia CCMP2878 TaxID=1169474 RepID=A0A0G4HPN1_9ALVE|eukprot:Cvel_29814.t1-p1 / transcript=Cvel_29814.t1 / gene=Cvel_29814 / organism=Chromera_velia_CCMP2878 / gene_product=hypothetical protein / transcript_product=hypothetical protein / location=Cvel_scaffold4151:1253-1654(-) / protein_length=134 / sequence_SO=supercontig / SO=protein_coding / is_pseudo=false